MRLDTHFYNDYFVSFKFASVKCLLVKQIKILRIINVIEKNITLQNDRIISDFSVYLFYHDVATFIRTSLLIPFVLRNFILPANSYSGYFTLILFVSLVYVICFILARLLLNL